MSEDDPVGPAVDDEAVWDRLLWLVRDGLNMYPDSSKSKQRVLDELEAGQLSVDFKRSDDDELRVLLFVPSGRGYPLVDVEARRVGLYVLGDELVYIEDTFDPVRLQLPPEGDESD